MTTYIVKTLLCAAVLFLIYVLLLEREKMHRFNRFYLLISIVFSLTVSFITIKSQLPVIPVSEMITPTIQTSITSPAIASASDLQQVVTPAPIEERNLLPNLLLWIYLAVTAFLLFRFIRNLSVLLTKVIRNKSVAYHGARLVLTSDDAVPHSFLKYIFIDKEKYEQGTIEKEILQHELTHVNQKHSIDILMVELIMVFAWINPLLYLYRKAILLNHEYLADEAVVNTFNDAQSYQLLLFSKASQTNNLVLSSSFNYLITKKRLIMMTRKTSQRVAILKQIALIPLIAAIGFLFSTRVIAQDKPNQPVTQKQYVTSKTDAPQSVIEEYHAIIAKFKLDTLAIQKQYWGPNPEEAQKRVWIWSVSVDTLYKIDRSDRDRLKELYFQMSEKQQHRQFVAFRPIGELQTIIVPTKKQIELWKNPKIYGIWIGAAHRVKNSYLNTHPNTDFYRYALRKLNDKEAKYMKYKIEVALSTKEQFEHFRSLTLNKMNENHDNYNIRVQMWSKKALEEDDATKE